MQEPEGDKWWRTDGKAPRCSLSGPGKRGASPLWLVSPVCLSLPLLLPPGSGFFRLLAIQVIQ